MEAREPASRSRMYRYIKIALFALGALLVLLCAFLIRDYYALRHDNIVAARELSLSAFVEKHGPFTADETGVIRPWMTFDYVNRIFALPPDFLKNSFHIDDPHYPNLVISRYASSQGFDPTEFTLTIESAVGNHLRQH